ncbi:hypothetical protein B9J78_02495 [bacterium Unc6]|nr:hypothetical protein [bacterium Unc6]
MPGKGNMCYLKESAKIHFNEFLQPLIDSSRGNCSFRRRSEPFLLLKGELPRRDDTLQCHFWLRPHNDISCFCKKTMKDWVGRSDPRVAPTLN